MNMKRALPISGWLKIIAFLILRNRHLAEWRFLLFTVIVMVKLPICTVKVIGTMLTPFVGDVANRLSVMAMLFPAPDGVNVILSEKSKNVNSGVALDFSPLRGIINMKRALPISGQLLWVISTIS